VAIGESRAERLAKMPAYLNDGDFLKSDYLEFVKVMDTYGIKWLGRPRNQKDFLHRHKAIMAAQERIALDFERLGAIHKKLLSEASEYDLKVG
jgi:hypothetical protein